MLVCCLRTLFFCIQTSFISVRLPVTNCTPVLLFAACTFSFMLASEVLLTMNSVVTSVEKYLTKSLEEAAKGIHAETTQGLLSALRIKLGISAQKLLRHDWNNDTDEDGWKRKVGPLHYTKI